IPIVVAKCGSYLKRNGLETIGIFRLSGSAKRVNNLQHIFDSLDDSYGLHHNWEGYSIHDVGSVLRRYFLQLPDPVIPFDFYKKFRDVMMEQRIDAFQSLICQLPTPHQHLLLYVLDLLRLFASNASVTRMDASNLAAVFTPGLLHHPSHNSPIEYKISQRVIEFLIEFQSLFTMDLLVDIPLKPIDPDEALVSPNIHHHSKKKINRRKTESDAPSPSTSTSLDSISSPLSAKSEPSCFLPPPPVPTLPPHLQTFNKLSPAYIPQPISNEQQLNIISDSPITYRDHHDSQSIISDDDNIPTPRPGSPIHKKNSFFLEQCISKLKINYYNNINNGSCKFCI
ncbi:Rho GTPase activation protein, partial [Cunninghamella echinulata]